MAAQGMDAQSAIEIINELVVFAPDWTIQAEPYTHRFENTIRVNVNYPAVQTAREEARDGYQHRIHADAGFLVVCDCNDAMTLHRKVIEQVLFPIHHHEVREMYRVRPTLWAPFHPHKIGGMEAWGDKPNDMMFGLA